MKHLENMPLYQMRNETVVRAAQDIYDVAAGIGPGAIGIAAPHTALGAKLTNITGSLDQPGKSALTAKIKNQNILRGNLVRSLSSSTKAFLIHPNEAKRSAAERLSIIIDRYGNITKKTYDDESAAIGDLVSEFSNTTNAQLVILLGVGEWVTLLDNANKAFVALMLERNAERTRRAEPMRLARAPLEESILEIVERVEAIIVLNGIDFSPELGQFVLEYNELVKRYKHILAQEGRHKGQPEDEEEEEEEE